MQESVHGLRRRLSCCVAAFAMLTTAASPVMAAELLVLAAASLKESLDEQIKLFSASNKGVQVRVSYAASNALARQIESGAPANLFISADEEWMELLQQG